ncbi:O-methyltransferase [Xylaria digitata]|nr:O-methyltransferase [Xylaria digitata]
MEAKPIYENAQLRPPDMLNIAKDILRDTERLVQYLSQNNLQAPTYDLDSIDRPDTDEYLSFQARLVANLEDLQYLVQGPKKAMRIMLCLGEDLAALQVAFQLDFFDHVPSSGAISVAELALKVGLDEDRLCRFIRILATHRIFTEQVPGYFSHTPSSILFHNDEELKCTGQYILDEMFKAATESASCVQATPHLSDSIHSPFATRHQVPLFKYYEQNPHHAKRFAKAMAGWTKLDRHIDIKGGFPWSELRGTVLDVGGGSGHVSMALAKEFSQLSFIVQDLLPQMRVEGNEDASTSVMDRVTFMQHNFFEPQPFRDVAAVLLRQVTHNWTDEEVVGIFKALVPTMESSKPGTPLLINDTVMPEPGQIPMHMERELRAIDMLMFVCLGAKQRTQLEFEELLRKADERFIIHGAYVQGSLSVIEVHLGI